MSQVPRKRNTIILTDVVSDAPPAIEPLSVPFTGSNSPLVGLPVTNVVRRNRWVAGAALSALMLLVFALGRTDSESVASAGGVSDAAEIERLRARVAELEAELARFTPPADAPVKAEIISPPENDNAPISPRVYTPDGSERDDPYFGPKESDVIAMVFSDFQCKLCREFHLSTMPKIRTEYADKGALKLLYRDFPLAGNTHSRRLAAFAHCAGEQGEYWAAFDLINANEKAFANGDFSKVLPKLKSVDTATLAQCMRTKRYETELDRDQTQGLALGAKGAPAVFVGKRNAAGSFDGVFIRGAQPYPVIKQEIDRILR